MTKPTLSQRVAPFGDAKGQRGQQQQHAEAVERNGQRHQPLRRHLRHDQHQAPSQQHVARVVAKAGAVVIAGRVHAEQAPDANPQHRDQQRHIEANDPGPQMLAQRGAFNDGHGRAPEAAEAADAADAAALGSTGAPAAARPRAARRASGCKAWPSWVLAMSSSLGYWPLSR